jgi:hypothetical protein
MEGDYVFDAENVVNNYRIISEGRSKDERTRAN